MMPSKGLTEKAALIFVITHRLVLLTEIPPTATVSVPLRMLSCHSLPVTGVEFVPVEKVSVVVRPPSINVELFDASNLWNLVHPLVQVVLGNSSDDDLRESTRSM
jgi:hypothetical protein